MSLSYRPEVDGLRALAVLTVVLFHAGIPGFSNGFLGVDIFFVISGFLITSIIAREQTEKGFSYGKFLMRRVRRILPALVVVMLACIPFAWWLMLPDPSENFGQSLVATVFSANNILLWLTGGYWDLSSDYKPLLHTWSLGVEEQFYLLYPFILLGALRLPLKACYLILTFLAALSFVLMWRALGSAPQAAFYLIHYRAWQLLVGGIAGLVVLRSDIADRPVLAGAGLAMLLAALIPAGLPMAATLLLASCGTALYLVFASQDSPVTWLFTRRPMVFIGLLSYSFYLWHQPIFAFLRVTLLQHPGIEQFSFAILLSLCFAWLSWRFVEEPFRSPLKVRASLLWAFVGTGMSLSLASGLAFHFSGGFPQRMGPLDDANYAGVSIAYNERIRRLLPRDIPPDNEKPAVLIAGNSFARDFSNVLLEAGLGERLMLLYRDDLSVCPDHWREEERLLVSRIDALIYASGYYPKACHAELISLADSLRPSTYFIGPKHFGDNLNPLVRYTSEERSAARLQVPEQVRGRNAEQLERIGREYVDILGVLSDDGGRTVRVADEKGDLMTMDQVHFSQAGAVYAARHLKQLLPDIYTLGGSLEPSDHRD